jgi:hypothetical protein
MSKILKYEDYLLLEQYDTTEEVILEAQEWADKIAADLLEENPEWVDEGFLSKLIGGAAGFIVGPTIGRVVARALGIEKGVLYDMLTSRLVTTALGAAIANHLKTGK